MSLSFLYSFTLVAFIPFILIPFISSLIHHDTDSSFSEAIINRYFFLKVFTSPQHFAFIHSFTSEQKFFFFFSILFFTESFFFHPSHTLYPPWTHPEYIFFCFCYSFISINHPSGKWFPAIEKWICTQGRINGGVTENEGVKVDKSFDGNG